MFSKSLLSLGNGDQNFDLDFFTSDEMTKPKSNLVIENFLTFYYRPKKKYKLCARMRATRWFKREGTYCQKELRFRLSL